MWDVFISHASEDKDKFVRPLASTLESLGVSVWFDELTLTVGDSLARSIDQGLGLSRFGLVVLSPSFFAKAWPERELRGLVAREVSDGKVILPIWLRVTRDEVLRYSPPLADVYAIVGNADILSVAIQVVRVVKPEIYADMRRRLAYLKAIRSAPTFEVDPNVICEGPIRHATFPDAVLIRVRLMHEVLATAYPSIPLQKTIDSFQRDTDPLRELAVWERIAVAFLALRDDGVASASPAETGRVLLQLSFGEDAKIDSTFDPVTVGRIRYEYVNAVPEVP